MDRAIQAFMRSLAAASDLRELRLSFMDSAGTVFGARAWGFYLLDGRLHPEVIDVRGAPESFVLRYEEVGRAVDPVMGYILRRHAPAHERSVLSAEAWRASALYQHVSSRYGLEHIMTGPLVGGGRLIGHVNFARSRFSRPFDHEDLVKLSSICAHLCADLAAVHPEPVWRDSTCVSRLTRRELQIADLVALGYSNLGIAAELWVSENTVKQALKRIFRKLDVSARAEMVARLRELSRQD